MEVFINEKGEHFYLSADGKIQIVSKKDISKIFSEITRVQVQANFVLDENGKSVEVQFDKNGNPFYLDDSGKKIELPR